MGGDETNIQRVRVSAYEVPTDRQESDGTLRWQATTMVAVHIEAGGRKGFGYTYAHKAAGGIVKHKLSERLLGQDAMDVPRRVLDMVEAIRNDGQVGLCRFAVSAVDAALWDLKAKLLDLPLCRLLGQVRPALMAYGSGGFTSYSLEQLREQLGGWAAEGFSAVKMKIARDASADPMRIAAARQAVGDKVELFVDANGGYASRQAVAMAEEMARFHVTWFEEPVHHRDVEGLGFVRRGVPPAMAVAVGEYGQEPRYFRRLLEAGAIDVLMADATRCGISGFLQAATLCEAFAFPLSAHCAPSLHLHPCLAATPVWHMEYFHDHVRLEHMLLDGAATAKQGLLHPDLSRPGMGVELKTADAAAYEV